MGICERRRFFRHPTSVPVRCRHKGRLVESEYSLQDISNGGLAFLAAETYRPGDLVELAFPSLNHHVRIEGEIVWSRALGEGRAVNGVKFHTERQHMRARLVEQMCQIERYRRVQNLRYGRDLTSQQAAGEWIRKFAAKFPG